MKGALCATLSALLLTSLAANAQPRGPSADWSRVRLLPPATEVIVAVTAGGIGTYRIAFADDETLVLVRPVGRKLSPAAEHAIAMVGPNWPTVLGGREMIVDSVRVTADSILDGGVRVGGVFLVPRAAVTAMRLSDTARVPDVLVSAAAVGMLVAASAVSQVDSSQWDRTKPPAMRPYAPTIFQTRDRTPDERRVVYRAPASPNQSEPLSESAVQRILQSIGPIGRKR